MTRTTLLEYVSVSTHSRPKAAGVHFLRLPNSDYVFQHTAARRRLATQWKSLPDLNTVSTHSRPKAAGNRAYRDCFGQTVSTHSRPKAAGSLKQINHA